MKGLERVKKRRGRLGRDFGNVRLAHFTHEDYYAYSANLRLLNRAEKRLSCSLVKTQLVGNVLTQKTYT